MKAAEFREHTVEELKEKETELAEQLFALRLQKVTGQLDNPTKMATVRRDMARVLTVLREKNPKPSKSAKPSKSKKRKKEKKR